MTRWALILMAACALTAGCGDDDSPTAASSLPLVFSAVLTPSNENPPITNAESVGRGAVQVHFDVTRGSAGEVTGGVASFYFQLSGFPAGTTTVGAHIHPGAAGVNGPVIVSAGVSATVPVSLANGSGEATFSGITVSAANMQGIIANPAGFYFNVHSPLNPGGFARGQLVRVQ